MIAPIGRGPSADEVGPKTALRFPLSGRPEVTARRMVVAGDRALPVAVRENVVVLVTELVNNAVRRGGVGPKRRLRLELEG